MRRRCKKILPLKSVDFRPWAISIFYIRSRADSRNLIFMTWQKNFDSSSFATMITEREREREREVSLLSTLQRPFDIFNNVGITGVILSIRRLEIFQATML